MRRNPWRKILVLGSIVSLLAATPGVDLMASELPESYGETSEAAESNEAVFSSAGTDNRNLKEMPDTECIAEGNDLYSGVVTGNNEANTGETFDETIQVTQAPENTAVNSANSDIGDSVPFESELSGSEEIDPEIGTPASEAGLDVITVTNSYTVTKAIEKEGVYESSSSGKADIVERSFDGTDSSETVAIPGYDLYDADSAYMVTHDPAGEINLKMNYGEISFSCEATAGNRIVFDKKGYIELLGESSDYLLGMYSEDGYPTKWSSIEAFGNKACRMSLLQTENGYILSGDVLSDVLVKVKNDTESATVSFSSPETSALICEADDEGVDVKFDTDSDGNYETSISEIKSIEKASVGGVSLSYGYTGKAHTPAITVKVDGVTLVKDIDYTAEYENNIKPGTARITITGKGKYKDTRVKTFKIADCVSTLKSGKIYQIVPKNNPGTAMCPVLGKTEKNTKIYITNRSASKSLKFKALKNSDGTWKFVNVKSGRVLAVQQNSSAAGAGIVLYDSTTRKAQNWKLSKKADNSFAIVNSVTGYSISVSDQSVVRGTTLKMAESAKSGLQRFYFTDKEYEDEGDAGFDTDGNDATSLSNKKSIEKASVGGVSLSYGYTGKAHTPAITVKVDGVTLVKDIDYTAEYENNIKPGTARITITGKGKYKDTRVKTFKIADCVSTLKSGKIYQIVPKNNPGTAMCPVLGKTEKNTKIYITNRSASKSLKFKALKNSDGTWKFVNVKSGRVLAVQQNSSAAGAGIVLYDSTTRKAQNWKLSKKADNSFAIVNSVTGYSISVSDQSVVRGTTLKMAESARSGLQRFYFTDKEYEDDDNDTGEDELLPSGKEDEGNTGITSGVTVTTNAESIEISEPTVKLYGLLGKIGGTGLQSMAVAGKYIYTYAGTSGRFYRTPLGELNPVSTLHTMEDAYIIDKGNGMTSDGTNLYLTGANNMVYTVPISAFNAKSGLKYSKATNIGVTLNGICYDSAKKEMYGYRKDDTEKLLRFYKIDLSAQKNRATAIFQASWSEAIRYDQDMEVIGNYFYVVSDYPGSMVKISKSGKVVQSYRLSQYTDRGAYTGEFEGIVGRGDRILLASAYTGYLSADSVLPAIGSVNPKDNVTLRQSRTIVFSEIDPVKDITPYDPYMRGAVAMQKAVVYVNWNKNTFKPDGTEKYPFPSPVTAFNARKNPRYEYIFKIVKPELDVNDRPFMIIGNQKDVTIDLSKECSNSKGIMSLYIYNSRITLSSSTDFRISYLVDSDVNYVSSPKYCKSVMNYDKGNNSSRFNCAGQMSNDFGSAGSTPNGNYVYNRQIGNSSGSPIALPNTKAVRLPAGKTFHISVLLKSDGATYYGSGFAIRGKTYLTLFTGTGDAATVELGYDSSKDSVYISRIRRKSAKSDETDFSQVVLSVNMA